jgi:hypothetical protein
LRSAVSHRAEDALSGRITPIFGVLVVVLVPEGDELQAVAPPRASRPVAASRQMLFRI